MSELTNRINSYYNSIKNCRYVATTAFVEQDTLDKNGTMDTMKFVDILRWRCAMYRDIEVDDIQLEVHLEVEEPYAVGWTKCKGKHGSCWKFEERWILKKNVWYNQNIFPSLG